MLRRAIEKGRLWKWRRNQAFNLPLRAHFRDRHRIDIGLYSYGCFDEWRMPGPMRVGRYCSIAKTVRSVPINHPYSAITTSPVLYERKFGVVENDIHWDDALEIGDDVWIGHYAVILPGCRRIGRGAIIGAGAIVTRDVEPYTIVAGNPARKLKDRFAPDLVEAIEASRWWELTTDDLRLLVARQPDVLFRPNTDLLTSWRNGSDS